MGFILTAEEMKQAEALAVEQGDSFLNLMERAGKGAACWLLSHPGVKGKPCVVLAGKGNNGGDGFVTARHLKQAGVKVTVILACGFPAAGNARVNFGRLQDTGVDILAGDDPEAAGRVARASILIDAVFGTGFHGELPEAIQALFALCSRNEKALKIALDIPSGGECDSGQAAQGCFQADVTLTFAACKRGHYLFPCASLCGETAVVDIGIPEELLKKTGCALKLLEKEEAVKGIPHRARNSHKGAYGHLLLLAGSVPYTGAAILSTSAALKSGAGLVTLASVSHVTDTLNFREPAAMTLPLPQTQTGGISGDALPVLLEKFPSYSAVVAGPGMGNTEDTFALVQGILETAECPVILDADALNALSSHEGPSLLKDARCPLILTPHPGEMARLTGRSVREVEENRLVCAAQFAKEYGVIVVLKGTYTVIAGPDGQMVLNTLGNSGLAKGGSGDLLAGLAGGLAAGRADPLHAAASAVFLHAKAADLCAAKLSEYAMGPLDVAAHLGDAFLSLV